MKANETQRSLDPPADGPRPVVRETTCKTILNQTSISDYSMNCYTGCAHACAYCYARFMQRFHPHAEPWGAFVDVKVNAVEALERQVRRRPPGDVFVSSACDAWQPEEQRYELTRHCCKLLLEHGFRVNALTKSALILRDLDLFTDGNARVAVTITTLDPRLQRLWEPCASPMEDRLDVLRQAQAAGIETGIMFGPLLPFLSDAPHALRALFSQAAALKVDEVWVDSLNPRPKVWESVKDLLRAEFPELVERYRRVLFSQPVRAAYLKGLAERVDAAAASQGLAGRVTRCF